MKHVAFLAGVTDRLTDVEELPFHVCGAEHRYQIFRSLCLSYLWQGHVVDLAGETRRIITTEEYIFNRYFYPVFSFCKVNRVYRPLVKGNATAFGIDPHIAVEYE